MSSRVTATAALISFDPSQRDPMYRQIAESLSAAIVEGRLSGGTRLPSSRELSDSLHLSRNTIMLAYDDLLSQGYLETRVGSGTFVSASLPATLMADIAGLRSPQSGGVAPSLSRRGRRISTLPVSEVRQGGTPRLFRPGVPGIDRFASEEWLRVASAVWREQGSELMSYGSPAGHPRLREAIADLVTASRGVRASPDQVIVVSGSQQALHLISMVLLDDAEQVWIEDPVRTAARSVFRASGQVLVPVPVDADGLQVEVGLARAPGAAAAYVSPSSQFPTGTHMSVGRRLALLEWAQSRGAWVIEDDYDNEFRYMGRPYPAMQGLDMAGCVIHSGSFSRAIFPSLRLGYLIVPQDLREAFVHAKALVDRQSPMWEQATLARFIEDGHFDRHIRRMRREYVSRQKTLLKSAARHLEGLLTLRPASSGLHLVGTLPGEVDDRLAEEAAYRHGVECTALSHFTLEAQLPPGLLLGYAVRPEQQIDGACQRLARALADLAGGRS